MTSFYNTSVPANLLKVNEVYVVYEIHDWRYTSPPWYKAKLHDLYLNRWMGDNNVGLLFATTKPGRNDKIFRDYNTVIIKTLEEHRDYMRCGIQTMVSKLYEEKTGQSGNPDSGPAGLILDFIV